MDPQSLPGRRDLRVDRDEPQLDDSIDETAKGRLISPANIYIVTDKHGGVCVLIRLHARPRARRRVLWVSPRGHLLREFLDGAYTEWIVFIRVGFWEK